MSATTAFKRRIENCRVVNELVRFDSYAKVQGYIHLSSMTDWCDGSLLMNPETNPVTHSHR